MTSIIGDYNNRQEELKKTLELMLEHFEMLPDAPYQVFRIEAEIRDYELRKERLNRKFSYLSCNLCKQPIYDEDTPVTLGSNGHFQICPRCIKTINQVKGTTELEEQFGITSPGTLKQDCNGPLQPLQEVGLVRKSEKCWLVHEIVGVIFYRVGRKKHNVMNSWIDELINQLEVLRKQKKLLEDLRPFPESHSQLFSLEAQIQDLQTKVDRVQGGRLPYRCSQCGVWLKELGKPTFFGTYTICSKCKEIVTNVMTTSEAEKKHGLPLGTIRRDNARGLFDRYKESGLFRLSGNIWLLHDVVVLDKYKELKSAESSHSPKNDISADLLQRSASIFNRLNK
ncbi:MULTISPECIES: hypothetical protein [unclassified Paenibacillus]|uniref:Uncharacterized protein n=1 Tax=Paenibacillus provencensis TaxID=441151 RepID=A0ABW3QH97_9BACL|nr:MULTISPECIES: hypothetical protein [unclassified Paenibacillus]MCM3130128.1 hypothetical protein [Paenibacillus sp. MER 78]SDX70126.1 hypothetical protein SAMN05518848_11216 [Paenibacillus sp. PDC88]SFS87962.1 hypothetical protein SAMN04488601_10612 [Paenibacillus sp. 453mf]